ncbi:DNA-binding domain-containing protein, AraC-type [Rivularia sp. PCC 7116]|uniref:AraC family transcriptional regulator n=1 Tax=Rivularia sp. PCC 7116 TaxID=373994 RepID=UPI00029F285B|nr:AraC family transcriptional regulator [Rivularia sp. PCC 7116]AFY54414.1 DNA-binding domain-containing protein, AraC-type [Rivularia sp. PCC 7116]
MINTNKVYQERRVWQPKHIDNIEIAYRDSSAFNLPAHFHEELEITLMQGSNWNFDYRGEKFTVPPFSFTLTQPGETHKASFESDFNCRFYGLRVKADLLKQLAEEIKGNYQYLPFFSTPVASDKELSQLIFTFHVLVKNSKGSILKQQSLLLQIVEKLILRYTQDSSNLKYIGKENQSIQRVKDYLNDNYAKNISLEELARIANFSPFYLNRAFRKQVGIPPHKYQTQIRIARAKNLLNNLSISQVAVKTGFSSQSHFGWHFKKVMGVTPKKYVKESNILIDANI